MELIKSIGYKQEEILLDIINLYNNKQPFTVDFTYSKGQFYKSGLVPEPDFKWDKYPIEGVTQLDWALEHTGDNIVDSIMLDPPFLISYGPSMEKEQKGQNIISKRFSCFKSIQELRECYDYLLSEAYRILKPGGILVMKTQNTVSSSKQYWNTYYTIAKAQELGFYCKDEFVLLAKNRMPGKVIKQQHARKHHSYFHVYIKK